MKRKWERHKGKLWKFQQKPDITKYDQQKNSEHSNTKTGRLKAGTGSLMEVPTRSLEQCQTHSHDKQFETISYRLEGTLEVKWE